MPSRDRLKKKKELRERVSPGSLVCGLIVILLVHKGEVKQHKVH